MAKNSTRNLKAPTKSVVKRIFARSGNLCAFPKCLVEIVQGNTVVGEICHIKAAKPDGPRYDAEQTDAERHGYDNLILLCPNHHTVIDDDPEAYTVSRLLKMKTDHEQSVSRMSDDEVERGTRLLIDQSVTTIHQLGGIAAHTISAHTINVHSDRPKLNEAAVDGLEFSFQNVSAITADPPGPLRRLIFASIRNLSGVRLDMCRIQLRTFTHNGYSITYPIGKSFSLLVDEDKHIPILEYRVEGGDHRILIPIFAKDDEDRSENRGGLVLTEESIHEIVLEAISSRARICRLKLVAKYENNDWKFSVA